MSWANWAADVTNWPVLAWSPIDEDGSVVIGMALITDEPPGRITGVMHLCGDEAVNEWCDTHPEIQETWRTHNATLSAPSEEGIVLNEDLSENQKGSGE